MTNKKLTPKEFEDLPFAHVRGTASGHDDVRIIGTENGLREIIRCCEMAIKVGKSSGQIWHCGGEGSGIEVQKTNTTGLRSTYENEE